jgi:hypothetical protein
LHFAERRSGRRANRRKCFGGLAETHHFPAWQASSFAHPNICHMRMNETIGIGAEARQSFKIGFGDDSNWCEFFDCQIRHGETYCGFCGRILDQTGIRSGVLNNRYCSNDCASGAEALLSLQEEYHWSKMAVRQLGPKRAMRIDSEPRLVCVLAAS